MPRSIRTSLAVVLVLTLTFASVAVFERLLRPIRWDCTQNKIYSLSQGTRNILGNIHQPLKLRLYYSRLTAMKMPEGMKAWDDYYRYVRSLLERYVEAGGGNIQLEIIDPRPWSDQEQQAVKDGIHRYEIPISPDGRANESFFFGLAVVTQFGQSEIIPFLDPDRQEIVEYDITGRIEAAITLQRDRKKVGILSPLPAMGDQNPRATFARGQRPEMPWAVVREISNRYQVVYVGPETERIDPEIKVLLVVHPRNLSQSALFAVDQYVLSGGRAIVFVDPMCMAGNPQAYDDFVPPGQETDLSRLLASWGLRFDPRYVVADDDLAMFLRSQDAEKFGSCVTFLRLNDDLLSGESVITAGLKNPVFLPCPGELTTIGDEKNLSFTRLFQTTNRGSLMKLGASDVEGPAALSMERDSVRNKIMRDPWSLTKDFRPGDKPITMAYAVKGAFQSAFPDGIAEVSPDADAAVPESRPASQAARRTGLKVSRDAEGSVVVIADVDLLYDDVVLSGENDNVTLLMNAIDYQAGSTDLLAIRSRGGVGRRFTRVDRIEREARAQSAEKERGITAAMTAAKEELESIHKGAAPLSGEEYVNAESKFRKIIADGEEQMRGIAKTRREAVDALGGNLANLNMLIAPGGVLALAILLFIYRVARCRHYRRRRES